MNNRTLIVFWIPPTGKSHVVSMKDRIKRFVGPTMVDGGGNLILGGTVMRRRATAFNWTAFDPTTEPPTLVNANYAIEWLWEQVPKLMPPFYIRDDGAIIRTCDGEIVMEKPLSFAEQFPPVPEIYR